MIYTIYLEGTVFNRLLFFYCDDFNRLLDGIEFMINVKTWDWVTFLQDKRHLWMLTRLNWKTTDQSAVSKGIN